MCSIVNRPPVEYRGSLKQWGRAVVNAKNHCRVSIGTTFHNASLTAGCGKDWTNYQKVTEETTEPSNVWCPSCTEKAACVVSGPSQESTYLGLLTETHFYYVRSCKECNIHRTSHTCQLVVTDTTIFEGFT